MKSDLLESVVIEPQGSHQSTVIWLHGLGADGHDFAGLVPSMGLPETLGIRFVFPHAPVRPITLNGGYLMRGWYDIATLARERFVHDQQGIQASQQAIDALIDQEMAKGIPASRILLAGFSQGGAIALAVALHSPHALAGVLALSTYLPAYPGFESALTVESRQSPIAFYHGTLDTIIPASFAERSILFLKHHGYAVDDRLYPMEHTLCMEEIQEMKAFIQDRLGIKEASTGSAS